MGAAARQQVPQQGAPHIPGGRVVARSGRGCALGAAASDRQAHCWASRQSNVGSCTANSMLPPLRSRPTCTQAPINAVWASVLCQFIIGLPLLYSYTAFAAITSISVVGLYISVRDPLAAAALPPPACRCHATDRPTLACFTHRCSTRYRLRCASLHGPGSLSRDPSTWAPSATWCLGWRWPGAA